jgi:hypothetical protein
MGLDTPGVRTAMQPQLNGQALPSDFPFTWFNLERRAFAGAGAGTWTPAVNTQLAGDYRLVLTGGNTDANWANAVNIYSDIFTVSQRALTLTVTQPAALTRAFDNTTAVPTGWTSGVALGNTAPGFTSVNFTSGIPVFLSANAGANAGVNTIRVSNIVLSGIHLANYTIEGTIYITGHITAIAPTLRLQREIAVPWTPQNPDFAGLMTDPDCFTIRGHNGEYLALLNPVWTFETNNVQQGGGPRILVLTADGLTAHINNPGVVLSNYVMNFPVQIINGSAMANGHRIRSIGDGDDADITYTLTQLTGTNARTFGDAPLTLSQVATLMELYIEGTPLADFISAGVTVRLERSDTENGFATGASPVNNTSNAGWYRIVILTFTNVNGVSRLSPYATPAFEVQRYLLGVVQTGTPFSRTFNNNTDVATGSLTLGLTSTVGHTNVALTPLLIGVTASFNHANVGASVITINGFSVSNLTGTAARNYALPSTVTISGSITPAAVRGVLYVSVRRQFEAGNSLATVPQGTSGFVVYGFGDIAIMISSPILQFGTFDGIMTASTGIHHIWLTGGNIVANDNHALPAGGLRLTPIGDVFAAIFAEEHLVPYFTTAPTGWTFAATTVYTQEQFMRNHFNTSLVFGVDVSSGAAVTPAWLNTTHSFDVFNQTTLSTLGIPVAQVEFRPHGSTTWTLLTGMVNQAGDYRMVLNPFVIAGTGFQLQALSQDRMRSPNVTVSRRGLTVVNAGGGTILSPPDDILGLTATPEMFTNRLAFNETDLSPGLGLNTTNISASFTHLTQREPMLIATGSLTITGVAAPNYFIAGTNVFGHLTRIQAGIITGTIPTNLAAMTFNGTSTRALDTTRGALFGNTTHGFTLTGIMPEHEVDVTFNVRFVNDAGVLQTNVGIHNIELYNFTLSGANAGLYILPATAAIRFNGIGQITPATLTVVQGNALIVTEFTGNTTAPNPVRGINYTLTGPANVDLSNITVLFEGTLVETGAGTSRTVAIHHTGIAGEGASNFNLVTGSNSFSVQIVARTITLDLVGIEDMLSKEFDGTTTGRTLFADEARRIVTATQLAEFGLTPSNVIGATFTFDEAGAGNRTMSIAIQLNCSNNSVAVVTRAATISRVAVTLTAPSYTILLGRQNVTLPGDFLTRQPEISGLTAAMRTNFSLPHGTWIAVPNFNTEATSQQLFRVVIINQAELITLNPNFEITFTDNWIYLNAATVGVTNVNGMDVTVERIGGWQAGWSVSIERTDREDTSFAGPAHSNKRSVEAFTVVFRLDNVVTDPGAVTLVLTLSEAQRNLRDLTSITWNGAEHATHQEIRQGNTVRIAGTNIIEFILFDDSGRLSATTWWILGTSSGIALLLIILLIVILLVMSSRRKKKETEILERKQAQAVYPMMPPMMLGTGYSNNMLALPGAVATQQPAYGRPAARPAQQGVRRPPVRTQGGVKIGPNGRPIQEARVVQNRPAGAGTGAPGVVRPGTPGGAGTPRPNGAGAGRAGTPGGSARPPQVKPPVSPTGRGV